VQLPAGPAALMTAAASQPPALLRQTHSRRAHRAVLAATRNESAESAPVCSCVRLLVRRPDDAGGPTVAAVPAVPCARAATRSYVSAYQRAQGRVTLAHAQR
jgi:hypothetical protein